MTPQDNVKLVKEYFTALNDHNADRASSYYADSANYFEASGASIDGKQAIKEMLERGICGEFLKGFPDMKYELRDTVADDKRVAAEWTLTGTHTGMFMGASPSNKVISVKGATVFQVADHKIISAVEYWNPAMLFDQLKGTNA